MNSLKNHKLTSIVHTLFFILLIGLLSLGQLERIQLTATLALYGHDLLLILWVGFNLITQPKFNHRLFQALSSMLGKLSLSFLAWIGVGLGIAWLKGDSIVTPLLYLSRLLCYGLALGQIYWLGKSDQFMFAQKKMIYWIYGLILFIAWFGLGQYLFLPDTRFLSILGWDDHYFRLISTLLDPSFTGLVLVFGLILGQRLTPVSPGWWLTQNLLIGTLALTYSRSSYLALLVVILWNGLSSARHHCNQLTPWLLYGVLLSSFIFLLPRTSGEGTNLARVASIQARSENIQTNFDLQLLDIGWGRGLFVTTETINDLIPDHSRIPDSWPIFIWQGMGVIGLLLTCKILFEIGKRWWNQPSKISVLLAVLVHGLFNASLTQPFVILIGGLVLLSLEFERDR